ncbi:hypothetical protein HQ590_02280 [bacterium]|nr:hypothetical protein [bacterium]
MPKGVTRRQALIAELCYLHPVWSCARVLREAGYSEKTALHAARQVMNTKGTKLALAQHRQTFMAHLGDRYSLEDATEDLVEIAKRGDNDATRLKAIERVLGHYGIIDPNVKSELYAAMGQYYADKIASLLREITPPKKRGYVSRWLLDMAAAEDPQEYETFEKALDVTPAKKRKPPGRNGGKDGGKTK